MWSSYIAQGEASPTFRRCLPILTDEIQDNPSQPSPEAVSSVTLDPIKLKINLNHHRWSRRILSMSLRETGEWGIQKPVLYSTALGHHSLEYRKCSGHLNKPPLPPSEFNYIHRGLSIWYKTSGSIPNSVTFPSLEEWLSYKSINPKLGGDQSTTSQSHAKVT